MIDTTHTHTRKQIKTLDKRWALNEGKGGKKKKKKKKKEEKTHIGRSETEAEMTVSTFSLLECLLTAMRDPRQAPRPSWPSTQQHTMYGP